MPKKIGNEGWVDNCDEDWTEFVNCDYENLILRVWINGVGMLSAVIIETETGGRHLLDVSEYRDIDEAMLKMVNILESENSEDE